RGRYRPTARRQGRLSIRRQLIADFSFGCAVIDRDPVLEKIGAFPIDPPPFRKPFAALAKFAAFLFRFAGTYHVADRLDEFDSIAVANWISTLDIFSGDRAPDIILNPSRNPVPGLLNFNDALFYFRECFCERRFLAFFSMLHNFKTSHS